MYGRVIEQVAVRLRRADALDDEDECTADECPALEYLRHQTDATACDADAGGAAW